jgi:plastocyanin
LHSKLSRRARLRALALAVPAAALTVVLGSSSLAGAAETPIAPTGKTDVIKIALTKGKLSFDGPESVTVGDQLQVINKTNPKQVGPHTFSLVTKGSLPKTRKAQKSCFSPKKICLAIAKWHGFNPKTEKITTPLVKTGPAGWSTMGDATGKKGDSWFTGEKKSGTSVTQQVTAEAGTTLYFICAVHPEMQGQVKVEAPVVPVA